jgi:hypothetical protein
VEGSLVFVLGPGFAGVHVGFSFGVSVFAPFLGTIWPKLFLIKLT